MKTKTDIENKILQTLDAFKSKLLSNIDAKRGYWCDETSEEGLQIICEGLEAFLIPFLDKPKDITKYIPLSDLKSEISRIYDVVSKEGFIATPYLDKDLKELGIDPPEFIDTVSYVLTCALHAKIILKDNNELDKETKEKIDYLIEKGINWIINTYIDKENEKGWAGFKPSESSLPHIYSTWSAIEALVSIFEYINESDESYPKELRDGIKRAKDILKDFKGWVLEFAKRQGNEWSDIMCLDIDIPTRTGVIYNIYGLNILYDIYEDGDKELLDLMIKELKKILEHWEFNKHRFIEDRFRSQRHRFIYQRSKRKLEKTLEYDDESILIVAIMVLSYILKRFESILSQVEYEEGINLKDALIGAIDQMIIELYNIYYKNGNNNLVDYNGTTYADLSAWSGNGAGSDDKEDDPLFVNAGVDYHIFSTAGSYHGGEWPPTTASSGTWTNDASNSPALDAGNPSDSYSNEPQSGNRINVGAYGNTVQASKSTVVVVNSWTGNVSDDWQTTGNWSLGTIPTATDDVTIPNGCPNYPLINDGTTVPECDDITIESAASVTIAPNGRMTVNGEIINNAGNSGLVIQSDATGTGSLIQNSTSGVDATVNQLLAASGRAWHMVGSPITAAPYTVFPSTSNLYYYDESTDDYWTGNNYDAGSTLGWTAFNSGNMAVDKGYLFNYFQTTLSFTGQLNTSTAGAGITINYTDHGGTAPNGSSYNNYDGWELVANPFTSAIDWTVVDAHAANLYDAIYVWDGANATYKSYVVGTDSWDGAGTNGGSQYIPAMQGFFVKVNESLGSGGTLDIPASARVHNSQAFWKNGDYETPDNFLRLKVSANGFNDETVVRFVDGATNNVDDHLDAYKLFSYVDAAPQIYTFGNEDHAEYSVNSLPNSKFVVTVPLKLYVSDKTFAIVATEMNFPN